MENDISRPTKIAVIGDIDSVIGFMAVGFDVRDCSSLDEAAEAAKIFEKKRR